MKRWLVTVGVILIGIGIVLYIWLGRELDQGMEPNANGSADYIGSKSKARWCTIAFIKSRLEVAVPYLTKYPHVKVIVSGGQGPDEDRTEASVMQDYLEQHGIDATRIIIEDQSTSTYENLVFSKNYYQKRQRKLPSFQMTFI